MAWTDLDAWLAEAGAVLDGESWEADAMRCRPARVIPPAGSSGRSIYHDGARVIDVDGDGWAELGRAAGFNLSAVVVVDDRRR